MGFVAQQTNIADADGIPIVVNTGTAAPVSALHVAGNDGTDLRALLTDTAGRQRMVGAAADGAAAAGDPLQVAGKDGSGNIQTLLVDTDGRVQTTEGKSATPAVTGPATSTTDTTILAASAARNWAVIVNESSAVLYIIYGVGPATSTNYSYAIPPRGVHEVDNGYTGVIHGVLSAGAGFARVTSIST